MIDSNHAMPMGAKLIDGVSLARFFGASPVAMLGIDAEGYFPNLGDGSIAGEMETWRDITERKHTEEALLQYQNMLDELKYKADVVKDYGDLPAVQCIPSQINQVVMNLVVNAAHPIGPGRGKGTGLGLLLSCGIVQKHHGSINMQTEADQGTTIHVTLPIHPPATQASDGASPI